MAKIAVIGDAQSVRGYKAFGLSTFAVNDATEAIHALRRIAADDYGVVFITERFCKDMKDEIAEYVSRKTPAVIPIPGVDGNYGVGMGGVKKSVERAVGADILFGGDR